MEGRVGVVGTNGQHYTFRLDGRDVQENDRSSEDRAEDTCKLAISPCLCSAWINFTELFGMQLFWASEEHPMLLYGHAVLVE